MKQIHIQEKKHLGQHHDHMFCTKCKNIIEFQSQQLENLQIQIAKTNGFHMLQHKMEIYGICSKCLNNSKKVIPLIMAQKGEQLIIKDFTGGKRAHMRLISMGLRPGDQIEIISNQLLDNDPVGIIDIFADLKARGYTELEVKEMFSAVFEGEIYKLNNGRNKEFDREFYLNALKAIK